MINFINVRFSIPVRLGIVGALFIVPICFLAYVFITQSLSDIAFSQKEMEGTRYLAAIWQEFARTAGTGGVSTADDFQRADFDPEFGTARESQNFLNARELMAKMDSGKTLIAAVADNSNLTLDTDLDSFYLMNAETVKMPRITSAALDIAAAAAEPANSATRNADFAVAIDRLRSSLSGAISSVATARKYNPDGVTDKALSVPSAALKSAGDRLIEEVSALTQGGGNAAIVNDAKRALTNETDSIWQLTNTELARLLQARLDKLHHTMQLNLAFAGLFLLAATGLSFVIGRGLSGRLNGLLLAMDKLVRNDVGGEVPYLSDVNETGKIAKVLASFKQTLIERSKLQSEKSLMEQIAEERRRNEEAREAAARQQSEVVQAIASGLWLLAQADLTVSLDFPFPGDFDRLRNDFNVATRQLREAMMEIATMGHTVHSGAGEMTSALDDLQNRTERQAASIEETAAALEEITATVRSSAQGAEHARKVVAAADQNAKRSAGVVSQAIDAMAGIAKASQQINSIIGLMDEIAFQTNLLALNAGVEAARAGDAGRGFAVVASEVRALAQRSADAAKEIKGLISMSTTQVNQGVKLVAETGESLEQILKQVGEINAIVANIATGANEQASGLGEINVAIDQMDQTTQQNAAMVEESTTACRNLTNEAEHLASLISRFNMGEDTRERHIANHPVPSTPNPSSSSARTTGLRTDPVVLGAAA